MSCVRRMSELILLSAQGSRRIPGKHCMSQSVSTTERKYLREKHHRPLLCLTEQNVTVMDKSSGLV